MHDQVCDGVLGHVGEHLLQFGSGGGLRGLAFVSEFSGDDGAERLGLAAAGFALRGDRVALGFPAGFGLLFGRDPQIDEGPRGGPVFDDLVLVVSSVHAATFRGARSYWNVSGWHRAGGSVRPSSWSR